ncbi:MAG: HEAT repeat domain-containing protein [Planctomycetaceae bacterium]
MRRIMGMLAFVAALFVGQSAFAQVPYNAQWIWYDSGNPAVKADAGTVWFRHMVRSDSPSTGAVRVVADEDFVIWVNGRQVGKGTGNKLYRFNLNGIVGRGPNVIAVRATNTKGKAGLFVDGEIRTQGGRYIPFDSGSQWKATTKKPSKNWLDAGYDVSAWKAVKVIGPHHNSPWKALALKESYLDNFSLAPGFELKRIADHKLIGSIVAFTWGNRGRLIASRERGPILSVIDTNNDGVYDKVVEYTQAVKNCQGLLTVGDDLYAVGHGPKGAGLYRLPDKNHDDRADSVEHIYSYRGGMAEHGPHSIVLGPDGWLYNNLGNHAGVMAKPEPTTPVRDSYEGTTLTPKYEDARGHARGIKVPGGTIWRLSPDGKKWWCETAGFRNEYDIAFNERGDIFTFDSDMEWDVGMPWYRPVRVNHCIPGAEFGWRSGAAKWPAYYFDSLPGTVDIGRGSPTGVVFYEHRQFPRKYQGAFIACDWSMGRIIAVPVHQKGATYTGSWENIVTGNPLNVSDIEVDRDGSLVFSTGGRRTQGGIYRVTYTGGNNAIAKASSVTDLLTLPQPSSNWNREAAANLKNQNEEKWKQELSNALANGNADVKIRAMTLLSQHGPKPTTSQLLLLASDKSASVRAFATWLLGNHSGQQVAAKLSELLSDSNAVVQRRACEAFVRSGLTAPVKPLVKILQSEDRWLRYAARITLERVPADQWKSAILSSKNPHVLTYGLLALHRLKAISGKDALQAARKMFTGNVRVDTAEQAVDSVRIVQLILQSSEKTEDAKAIGEFILQRFPTGNAPVDAEAARLFAKLQTPGAAEKIVKALETSTSRKQQIHYAYTLRYLNSGWNYDLKSRLLAWYEKTKDWEGGNSFAPYLANIISGSMERLTAEDRKKMIADWEKRPFVAGLIISNSSNEEISRFESVIEKMLKAPAPADQLAKREEMVAMTIEALGRKASPGAQRILRKVYDAMPDRRDQIARSLSAYPSAKNWPYLIRSLRSDNSTTLQLCIRGLRRTRQKSRKAEDVRAVILAALKLNGRARENALTLLRQLTGTAPKPGSNHTASIAHYQKWYSQKFPTAPPATLPKVDLSKVKYTYEQLVNFLERDPKGKQGDVERGRKIFAKAQCIKCHRFLKEGEIIGPDLTSVRRRFQRKEIIESLTAPSQVISDQYRMVTVVTVDGLTHNGMPIPTASDKTKVTLLLSDATKLSIPRKNIDEIVPSKVSVMPVGLLKNLTLQEIADLFAFLETSRYNAITPRDAGRKSSKTKEKPAAGGG